MTRKDAVSRTHYHDEDPAMACVEDHDADFESFEEFAAMKAPTYRVVDVPVIGGVAVLPDGRMVESTARVVRVVPVLVGEMRLPVLDDEDQEC